MTAWRAHEVLGRFYYDVLRPLDPAGEPLGDLLLMGFGLFLVGLNLCLIGLNFRLVCGHLLRRRGKTGLNILGRLEVGPFEPDGVCDQLVLVVD